MGAWWCPNVPNRSVGERKSNNVLGLMNGTYIELVHGDDNPFKTWGKAPAVQVAELSWVSGCWRYSADCRRCMKELDLTNMSFLIEGICGALLGVYLTNTIYWYVSYLHVYVYIYIHVFLDIYIYVWVYIYIYMSLYIHIYIYILCINISISKLIYIYIHVNKTHIHIYKTHIHIHIYIYIIYIYSIYSIYIYVLQVCSSRNLNSNIQTFWKLRTKNEQSH